MKCPRLNDLPPPPGGARGWPWTEECVLGTEPSADPGQWPRFSIVTPSYNQGRFIEETIRSVLLQGYPDIEYVVIDGGSTDESRTIIEKYSPWLSYWVSEPDRGQAHAINKGLDRCTGEIVAYINSDDAYLKHTFSRVARAFHADPTCDWLVGACYVIRDREQLLGCDIPRFTDDLEAWYTRRCGLPQPSTFLRKGLLDRNGLFEEALSYAFDHEYWIRLILSGHRPFLVRSAFAAFKLHDAAKTSEGPTRFRSEAFRIEEMHESRLPALTQAQLTRSRPVRHWESELRDGLQLCAAGCWKEGCELLLGNIFDVRFPKALFTRPDIVLRVAVAALRRLPQHLLDTLRHTVSDSTRSHEGGAARFNDPLGEYDRWYHPRSGSPASHLHVVKGEHEAYHP